MARKFAKAFYSSKAWQDCRNRYERNPLRTLDCKKPGCQAQVQDAPAMMDYLCDECRTHFEELKSCLSAMGIPYEVDSRIVRGLDYYTKHK